MGFHAHKSVYGGLPVVQWNDGPLDDPAHTAYRLAVEFESDEPWSDVVGRFVAQDNADQVAGVLIGIAWEKDGLIRHMQQVVDTLLEHQARLANLRALFIGDITYEENEISWIKQTDLTPLLSAFPTLEHFGSRGMEGLTYSYGRLHHARLRSFQLEAGGVTRRVVDQLAKADFPHLTDFELWTGSSDYGWDGTLVDVMPFISGEAFPNLTRLALCNSELTDEIAVMLSRSPLYPRLQHLDLSQGTLSDVGAYALLEQPHTRRLKTLDVWHHFCSPAATDGLRRLSESGVQVIIDEPNQQMGWQEDLQGRFVAVGE